MDDRVLERTRQDWFQYLALETPLNNKLCVDLNLVRVFEIDRKRNKRWVIKSCIKIDDIFITDNYTDTVQFIREIKLFDYLGHEQNDFFQIREKNRIKSLYYQDKDFSFYISKAQAETIWEIFNESKIGYSRARLLDYQFRISEQTVRFLLKTNKLVENIFERDV